MCVIALPSEMVLTESEYLKVLNYALPKPHSPEPIHGPLLNMSNANAVHGTPELPYKPK